MQKNVPLKRGTSFLSIPFASLFLLAISACSSQREPGDESTNANDLCQVCHGSSANAAPPRDASGNTSTTASGVGAHQSHMTEGTTSAAIACNECHIVPEDFDHASTRPQKITFGSLAKTGGLTPEWNGSTCANTYCHGSSLTGGSKTSPAWTTVDGSQTACGTCHGLPPTTHRSEWTECKTCHPATIGGSSSFVITDKTKHINGRVDYTEPACGTCHGIPPTSGHSPDWVNECQLCHSATVAGPAPHTITNPSKHINGHVDFE